MWNYKNTLCEQFWNAENDKKIEIERDRIAILNYSENFWIFFHLFSNKKLYCNKQQLVLRRKIIFQHLKSVKKYEKKFLNLELVH